MVQYFWENNSNSLFDISKTVKRKPKIGFLLHMKKKNNMVKNAVTLGFGTFIAKLLGALYRVPLTNLLGSLGLGLYQMVFPVYSVLLDFSGAGVPSALSNMISSFVGDEREEKAYKFLKASVKLLFIFGLFGSLIMAVSSVPLSKLQGNASAYLGYIFLSPAVLAVCLISCLRGYYQGLMEMRPTAVSQIVEQVIKLFLGLLFAYLMLPDIPKAVAGATFAITISELGALIQLYITYRRRKRKITLSQSYDKTEFISIAKTIIKNTVPITLIGVLLPLSQVIDSFLIINILSRYRNDATSLFGLLGGVVATVINLPVSICYGVATTTIPTVSSSKTQEEKRNNAKRAIMLTLAIALPSAILCYIFSPLVIRILFSRLASFEKSVAVKLLRLCSPAIIFLSLLQTTNAVLIGMKRLYLPILTLAWGICVKTVLNTILLSNPSLNIYGGGIALIACYFAVSLVNFILIFSVKVKKVDKATANRQFGY